jgi:pyruvate/2-oxoglutarate dehydrogenase complex dihydrolipoamide dehydrogenase (E3) component
MVVGGGPAGMETARIAAARGHHVTLYERARQLGGRALLAAGVEHAIAPLLTWLEAQLAAHDVEIVLDHDAGAAEVAACGAEVVVLATGAHVGFADAAVAGLLDANGADRPDELIVIGGNGPAALFAAVLAERKTDVTLASPHDNFGVGLSPPRLWRTMHALRAFDVTLVPNADLTTFDADVPTTIAFEPWTPAPPPFAVPAGIEVHRVGDCNDAPLLDGAMRDAAEVARAL